YEASTGKDEREKTPQNPKPRYKRDDDDPVLVKLTKKIKKKKKERKRKTWGRRGKEKEEQRWTEGQRRENGVKRGKRFLVI
ncbi:MAG: hypothetical protein Q8754_02745, partial [Sweet potato little leaf phytoplasma]|nr:hypothetical protein [Sweet potato little leaf phytoplasma]